MQYKPKNLKEKKSILYFNNLNFQKKNYNILKSKFRVLNINNVKNKDFSKIVSIVLPMNNFYSDKFFSKFPKLRSVVSPSTGDIHLDKKYLKDKKIRILNLSKFKRKLNFITSTSELTIGLILNCTRRILKIHENFVNNRLFKKYNFLLSNKIFTLGIVGMGRIGQHVANRAKALGFNVIYFDPNINIKKFTKEKSFGKFIKKTNILTIHMHFKKKFYGKYNNKIFKNLKKPSFVINTSRGEFINESNLINCLKKKNCKRRWFGCGS